KLRRDFTDGLGGLPAYRLVALALVTFVVVGIVIAARAAFTALRARYPRRVNIAGSVLLFHGLALILLALATRSGFGLEALTGAMFRATPWLVAAAAVLATIYLYWKSLAERLLTLRQLSGAILISAAFLAAGLTSGGVQPARMETIAELWPGLLLLMVIALAPWSLSRIRHM